MVAAHEGHLSVVELLVSVGAQVNSQSNVSCHLLCLVYRIAGNFRWCKFSYELNYPLIFLSLNIRTAQHSDIEHIVQGNFRKF